MIIFPAMIGFRSSNVQDLTPAWGLVQVNKSYFGPLARVLTQDGPMDFTFNRTTGEIDFGVIPNNVDWILLKLYAQVNTISDLVPNYNFIPPLVVARGQQIKDAFGQPSILWREGSFKFSVTIPTEIQGLNG